jgi:mannan endo-1,4-beta-mannosidase
MVRALELDSRGDDVTFLQAALNAVQPPGAEPLLLDGHLGPVTAGVVEDFQRSSGLPVDGEAGPRTWTALLGRPVTATTGFFVLGRDLYDRFGTRVVLRGVNKMSVFDLEDAEGRISFPEIRKTGANSVRIVWAITQNLAPGGAATSPARLDALVTAALDNHLIPMVELHDATGAWDRLDDLVDHWTRPAVLEVVARHTPHLLVNIGNEVGDDTVTAAQFADGYRRAVAALRRAGIHTPLVIDSADWGKDLALLNGTATGLLADDPDGNLLFSVHLYWSVACGFDSARIGTELQAAVTVGYPLIVGEFAGFGGFPCGAPAGTSPCSADGRIDHDAILAACDRHGLGWYAWEWGPGNAFFDPACSNLDMSTDRTFAGLQQGWATEVATTSPHGIASTAVTPAWL